MSARPRKAMILAAGRGERMRPLTDSVPKPLLEVRGKPLIEYHVEALARAGIVDIVINLAWLGTLISERLGDGSRFGVAIRYSREFPHALDTAGGIFHALPWLTPGPFLVVNGDIFTDFPFAELSLRPGFEAQLVLVPNPPQHRHGDFGLHEGLATPAADRQYTFAGIAAYETSLFADCTPGAFALKPLLVRAMAARRCGAQLHPGVWEDVGTPDRLRALNA